MTDSIYDILLILAGAWYLVISASLFLFGANMMLLSAVAWRYVRLRFAPREERPRSERPRSDRERSDRERSDRERSDRERSDWPRITVQLPIFNELYVAGRIIRAACAMDYPSDRLQVQVLDDSTDETRLLIERVVAEQRAAGVDIELLHRTDRVGYKAGALQAGMASASGEFIAIFDADFIPPEAFLTETVGHFDDPSVAFVQTRWGHENKDYSWITRLQALAIDGHFLVEQIARGQRNYWFNFNGTAGIWRASAIEDAGGWTHDTLTEDLDLSYRAHLAGWRGLYREDIEVPGELPAQISSFRRQQHRWARGSFECARKLLASVWRSDADVATKFQATMHLSAYGVHLLLFSLALLYPLVVLATSRFDGLSELYGIGYVFALSAFAPMIFFAAGQHQLRRDWWRDLPRMCAVAILGSGLMVNTVRAAAEIFTKPNPEFERTAKFGIGAAEPTGRSWTHKRYQLDLDRIILPETALGIYCLFSAWLAANSGNWGIFLYSMLFATGLLGVVGITVGQAIAVYRSRSARAGQVRSEEDLWRPRNSGDPESSQGART